MNNQIQIAELEYDVAGVGAAEEMHGEVNLAAFGFFFSAPAIA